MNPVTPILLTLATAVLLIWFGYRLGRRGETAESPLAAPPTSAPAWFGREEAIEQLKALRGELELDGEYSSSQALLLFDVGTYLGLDEGELQAVVGAVWVSTLVDEPLDLDLQDS